MGKEVTTRAYWVHRRGAGELRDERLVGRLEAGHSLVRARFSAVSAGTERLVGLGRVPAAQAESMSCRYMGGDFGLPIKYGYSVVGTGLAGGLEGRRVFVMHPHQELASVRDSHATPLPDEVPDARAVLIPNLETALNAVWDAELRPHETPVVVGGGAIGILVGHVLARLGGRGVTIVEPDPGRRELAASLPWVAVALAPELLEDGAHEVAFHTSGDPRGLQTALDGVGFEGRVVELSWYGDTPVTLDLGTPFHRHRKQILASQVSTIAPSHRSTHGFPERLAEVLDLLDEPALDRLLGEPVYFGDMPGLMADLYRGERLAPVPLVSYGNG